MKLKSAVLALFVMGCATSGPTPESFAFRTHEDLTAPGVTFEQRLDYLARTYSAIQSARNYQAQRSFLIDGMYRAFLAILQADGGYKATAVFTNTYGPPRDQRKAAPAPQWDFGFSQISVSAEADAQLAGTIAGHVPRMPFIDTPMQPGQSTRMLSGRISDLLEDRIKRDAAEGASYACAALIETQEVINFNGQTMFPALIAPCARSDSPARERYVALAQLLSDAEKAKQQAQSLLPQIMAERTARALEMERYCTSVGVGPGTALDENRIRQSAAYLRTSMAPFRHYDNITTWSKQFGEVLANRKEKDALDGGSAVTAVLTPSIYTEALRALCGR